jgi:pyroglutamyl-peptidase
MSHVRNSSLVAALMCLATVGCGSSSDEPSGAPPAAQVPRDSLPDGLFHDFLDGKYDGFGHPVGAQVWELESDCEPELGTRLDDSVAVDSATPAALCDKTSDSLGRGRFVLNTHALAERTCAGVDCDNAALELSVHDQDGNELASQTITLGQFGPALTYQNQSLTFSHYGDGPVNVRLGYLGGAALRVDYLELFRATRNLIVSPPSGGHDDQSAFVVEVVDPPSDFVLRASCGETDLTEIVAELLAAGDATRTDEEFRSTFEIPSPALLSHCPLPARVLFRLASTTSSTRAARVSVYDGQLPCSFEPGLTKVLLTGFEPFPADSSKDNSSEQAVFAFDDASVPGISVMRLLLPVEFDTAPDIAVSVIERCEPDVVIGFGQGRTTVDLETTAYNLKDSSAIAGGTPDNRGHIAGHDSIVTDGPAERGSGLPLSTILSALQDAQIAVNYSDDPGRYVCNNVFYRYMAAAESRGITAGFIHLPRIPSVDDEQRAMLARVVQEAVSAAAPGPVGSEP